MKTEERQNSLSGLLHTYFNLGTAPPTHVHSHLCDKCFQVFPVFHNTWAKVLLRPFQRALCHLGAIMCPLGLPQNQHIFNSHLNYLKSVWALKNKKKTWSTMNFINILVKVVHTQQVFGPGRKLS